VREVRDGGRRPARLAARGGRAARCRLRRRPASCGCRRHRAADAAAARRRLRCPVRHQRMLYAGAGASGVPAGQGVRCGPLPSPFRLQQARPLFLALVQEAPENDGRAQRALELRGGAGRGGAGRGGAGRGGAGGAAGGGAGRGRGRRAARGAPPPGQLQRRPGAATAAAGGYAPPGLPRGPRPLRCGRARTHRALELVALPPQRLALDAQQRRSGRVARGLVRRWHGARGRAALAWGGAARVDRARAEKTVRPSGGAALRLLPLRAWWFARLMPGPPRRIRTHDRGPSAASRGRLQPCNDKDEIGPHSLSDGFCVLYCLSKIMWVAFGCNARRQSARHASTWQRNGGAQRAPRLGSRPVPGCPPTPPFQWPQPPLSPNTHTQRSLGLSVLHRPGRQRGRRGRGGGGSGLGYAGAGSPHGGGGSGRRAVAGASCVAGSGAYLCTNLVMGRPRGVAALATCIA
jgi:hypothetical protein